MLLLDDLQWADAGSLDLLVWLLRESDVPLHVIGTYRDTEPNGALDEALGELTREGIARRFALEPPMPLQVEMPAADVPSPGARTNGDGEWAGDPPYTSMAHATGVTPIPVPDWCAGAP